MKKDPRNLSLSERSRKAYIARLPGAYALYEALLQDTTGDVNFAYYGLCFENPYTPHESPFLPRNYFEEAAALKDPYAINALGIYYQFGFMGSRSFTMAARCYREAANMGLATAKTNLGYLYEIGEGVRKDEKRAAYLYKEAADSGYPRAMAFYASMLLEGKGCPQNVEEGLSYLKRAADGEYSGAMLAVGQFFAEEAKKQPEYFKTAEYYLKKAIQAKAYPATWELYLLYKNMAPTEHEADMFLLLQEAYNNNIPASFMQYAAMHLEGKGCTPDVEKAIAILNKGIQEHKSATCATMLGLLYLRGEYIPKQEDKAKEYIELAIALGSVTGHGIKGVMLAEGRGYAQDMDAARIHLQIAAENGDKIAKEYLCALDADNTSIEVDSSLDKDSLEI